MTYSRFIYFWLFAILISIPFNSFSFDKSAKFKRLSIKDGLSQSDAYTIVQDDRGFIWIGTEEGLNRYDGKKFKIYIHNPKIPGSLSHNNIKAIYEDQSGYLWIGTYGGGLNRYDKTTEKFESFVYDSKEKNAISNDYILSIYQDSTGLIWIGTENGLNAYNSESGKFEQYFSDEKDNNSVSHNHVTCVYVDHKNQVWVGTKNGLNKFDRKKKIFTHFFHDEKQRKSLSDDLINIIREDNNNNLWIGTANGLNKFNPDKKNFDIYEYKSNQINSISNSNILSILQDKTGAFWVGTEDGLNVFDPEKKRFNVYRHDPFNARSLSNNNIMWLTEDRAGLIWIGTDIGINLYNSEKKKFNLYQNIPNNPNSLSHNFIRSILEDENGVLWIGTEGGGVNRFDRKTGKFKHYRYNQYNQNSLSSDQVRPVHKDENGIFWIGTYGGGLNRFDPVTNQFTHYFSDPDNPNTISSNLVRVIVEDNNGFLWIGTREGLNRFDRKTNNWTRYIHDPNDSTTISNDFIHAIDIDNKGILWIGTVNGLSKFNPETNTFKRFYSNPLEKHSISHNEILAVYCDNDNNVWLGTPLGLNKFNSETEQCEYYTMEHGLPNNVIYAVLEDNSGNLWLTSNNGLCRFNPETKHVKNYDADDGLQSNEFNLGAHYKSKSGELFVGGIFGLNSFYPDKIGESSFMPEVVITDFKIYNEAVPINEKYDDRIILNKSITETKTIELSYKDQSISFEFAALDFASPEKNQYAYILEPFETKWNNVGNRHYANYTNLPSGEFSFKIKCTNADGIWNSKNTTLRLTVIPPFYDTTWFKIFAVLFIIAVAFSGYKMRVRSINIQRKKLEDEVELRTKELKESFQELDRAKKETDNILHNVKDGLFLLNPELHIKSQYSYALESILSQNNLANQCFSDYLKGKIPDENYSASIDYLEMLFNKNIDENLIHELNPLSFTELKLEENQVKYLTFEFRRIVENGTIIEIIATVNDITEKIKLEKNLEESKAQSKKQMDWLLTILNVDPPMLKEFIKSSQSEISEINDVMKDLEKAFRDNLQTIYRSMHAIKGNASLLELDFISEKAHEVEETISKYKDLPAIDKNDFKELNEKITEVFGMFDEVKGLIDKISKIHDQFRPKRSYENQVLMKSLNNLTQRLAKDYNKKVEVKFDGFEGTHIPFQHRLIIRDILVQLMRNAIYHGIEDQEERKKLNKPKNGIIQISTRVETDSEYSIKCKDDGKGLDLEKLREKAIKLGEWNESDATKWDESTAADIIFIPGMTTADAADLTAGRGMGMDIIKEKVEKLGGKILIDSKSGKGCEFIINLPRK